MEGFFLNSTRGFKILFIGIIVFLLSCRKDDKPTTPPEIVFLQPAENTVHNVFDSIHVEFTVQDNDRITSVTLSLVDLNNQPVMAPMNISWSGNPATVVTEFYLDDIHLASGYYYLKAAASDGVTTAIALRKIYVNEVPKMLKSAWFVTMPTPGSRNVYKIDSLQNAVLVGTYAGDFSQACISSWYQDMYLGGYTNGDLYAISLDDNSILWSLNCIPSPSPYFTDVHTNGKNAYVSYYDGRIKGYNVDGAISMNSTVQSGWYPVRIARHEGYVAASIKELISPARKIVLFNASTGAGYQEAILNQDVVEMYTKDYDNLFCFGNDAGQGRIELYQLSTNGFWIPYNYPPGSILSVAQVDPVTYLIGHSNGNVYKYQYNISSMTVLIPGVTATHLRYDDTNLQVYVGEGSTIKRYVYANGALINTVNAPGPVADLELLFNK